MGSSALDTSENSGERPSSTKRNTGGAASAADGRTGGESFPHALLRELRGGRGIAFVGRGLASEGGHILRETLGEAMKRALRRHLHKEPARVIERFLREAGDAELAQALQEEIGREGLVEVVKRALPGAGMPPASTFYALRALPIRVICTTAIDRVIERAWTHPLEGRLGLEVRYARPGGPDPFDGESDDPLLVKLFGDPDVPESLVLTVDDYEAFFRVRPQLAYGLEELLQRGPALFVGFSLDDPDFRRLYSHIGPVVSRLRRRAYFLVHDAVPFEKRWWSARGLTLIGEGGDQGTEGVLRELGQQLRVLGQAAHLGGGEDPATEARTPANASWPLLPFLVRQLEDLPRKRLMSTPGIPDPASLNLVPIELYSGAGAAPKREHNIEKLLADPAQGPLGLTTPVTTEALEALGGVHRALVLGPSGSGKTTLLIQMLRALTRSVIEHGQRMLVICLPCSHFAQFREMTLIECLIEHVCRMVTDVPRDALEGATMDALLDGNALLLLDGLDDLEPDAEADLLERLVVFCRDCPKTRVVLTCRSGAFEAERIPEALEFEMFEIAPMSDAGQDALVRAVLKNDERRADVFLAAMRSGLVPWAARLASNPLHLIELCAVYEEEGCFAQSRPGLYESFIGILLRYSLPGQENILYACDKELILQAIAMHCMMSPDVPLTEDVVVDITEQEMSRVHIAPRHDVSRKSEPAEVIQEIVERSGILIRANESAAFEFRHGALREYLIARRLLNASSDEITEAASRMHSKRWAGVWRIEAALRDDSTPVLERVEQALPPNNRLLPRCFAEANRVALPWFLKRLGDAEGATSQLGALLVRLHQQLLPSERIELFSEIVWKDQEAFMRDGRRTDTRSLYVALRGLQQIIDEEGSRAHQALEIMTTWRGTGNSPGDDWPCPMVDVPEGAFLSGDPDSGDARLVDLPAFRIGKEPLTMEGYLAFNPGHSIEGLIDEPERFSDPKQPVVGITWYDAWVCAAWYGTRLPSALEWEKAAGFDPALGVQRRFPWGDEWKDGCCNTMEFHGKEKGATTVPGYFEGRGTSPLGCVDMAGNVFEWTADRAGTSQPERRVLKGGSWQAAKTFTPCFAAVWLKPFYRGLGVGMRLCSDRGER